MKIQKKYFVGKNRPGVWASVYAYKPHDDAIFQKRGEIFAAAILEGPADYDASVAGNLLLDILHETYFESSEKSALLALEDAVRTTKSRLINLVENDQATAINGINFDLICFVIKDKYLFAIRIGDGVLKVFRDGNLQDLAAGFRDPTGEGNYEVLSAVIEKNDVFFVSTPQTLENYSEDEIFEGVSEYSEINLKNKMLEDDSKIAMLLIGVDISKRVDAVDEMNGFSNQGTSENTNIEPGSFEESEEYMDGETDAPTEESKFTTKKAKQHLVNITGKAKLLAGKAGQKVKEVGKKSKLKINEYRVKRRNRAAGIVPPVITPGITTGVASGVTSEAVAGSNIDSDSVSGSNVTASENSPRGGEKRLLDRATIQVYLIRIWRVIKKVSRKVLKFIKEDLLDIKDKGFYLRDARTGGINYRVVVAIVIVLFVVFFVGMRVRRSAVENSRNEKQNKQLVQELATEVNSISTNSVFTINTPDNIEERESLLGQINTLEQRISNTDVKSNYKTQLQQYSTDLATLKAKLLREIPTDKPGLLTDLGANFEGANPSDITIVNGKIYVSDKDRNVIYEVATDGSIVREAFKNDIDGPRYITNDPESGIILVDESNTALALINTKNGQVTRFPGMSASKFANTQDIAAYKVGKNDVRMYMAMSVAPQVQQINKRGDAYNEGPKNRWSGPEFEGLSDIDLLDGKFLVIKHGEGLVRMFSNSVISTNVTGLLGSDSLGGATKLAVDATYIYVADPSGKRILVFTKSRGANVDYVDLVAQYKYTGTGDTFSNIVDIKVDATSIYVLDGAKVYKLAKSEFSSFAY